MKRLLMVAYDFPPRGGSGVFRVAKFARYLPEWGWLPAVVTVAGEGPHPDYRLLAELPAGIDVQHVRPLKRKRTSDAPSHARGDAALVRGGRRSRLKPWIVPDAQLGWVPGALQAVRRRLQVGDIDAILTSGPPFSTHLVGLAIKRRYPSLPWVMDMRDLWSEGFDQHSLLPYKLNRWLERSCVERADRVTVVTDAMGRLMCKRLGVPADKFVTITNGFDRQDFKPYLSERRASDVVRSTPVLKLCYVGTITDLQVTGIANVFAALEQLEAAGTTNLHLELVGAFGASVHRRAGALVDAGMVSFLPFQPHHAAIACMMDADVLLLVRPDDLDGRIVHTSKIFEYMAVGRPIFAISPPGEIATLVTTEHLGRWVAPGDVGAIVEALRAMLHEHRNGMWALPTSDAQRLDRWERRTLTGIPGTSFG